MTGVLEENKAIHQPFSYGRIDEFTAQSSTLSLLFHPTKVVYTVEDLQGQILAYGLCNFNSVELTNESFHQLAEVLPAFKLRYRKVWAAVSNNQYSLIPTEIQKRQHNDQYLSFTLGQDASTFSLIKQDNLFMLGLTMVYNINARLETLLNNHHTGVSVRHEKSVIAARALSMAEQLNNVMLVNLCDGHFDLLLIRDKKLAFLNSFPMTNTEEMLYYIFDVLKQLDFKAADFTPKIIGLKPLFFNRALVKKYLPTIKEYQFKDGDVYNDPGLYFTTHYLTR